MRIEYMVDPATGESFPYYVDDAGNLIGSINDPEASAEYVSGLGAEELLQLSVGLNPLGIDLGNPDIAAALDVNGDGRFSSADALETLKAEPVAAAEAAPLAYEILSKNERKDGSTKSYTVTDNSGETYNVAKEDFTDWKRGQEADLQNEKLRADMGDAAYADYVRKQEKDPTNPGGSAFSQAQQDKMTAGAADALEKTGSVFGTIFSDLKDDFAYLVSGDAVSDVKDDLISSYNSIVDGSAFTGKDTATSTAAPAQTFDQAFAEAYAQGPGTTFMFDGELKKALMPGDDPAFDAAMAGTSTGGVDSVISTGGPGTFAPGSLPAATGTSALDGYTQLADTMRDSGSLDLSGRTGSEAFSTGMAGDGSAAVERLDDLSAAEILNNQSNTIQPLKISTDVGAPLSTDIDNIDSAIIAAAQDDAKKNGFDLDTEQGMDEVDRILGERSDYDKLLAVAMDPMNSGYTDAMETLVTDYGVDANVIAIEADKALTEKENSDAALANANLDPALRFANENVSDTSNVSTGNMLNINPIAGLVAEAFTRGGGDVLEGGKQIAASAGTGAIGIGGKMLQGLDIVGNQIGKYVDSNTGDLAQGANPEYDENAQAFLSGMGGDGSALAATDKTVGDAELTRALNFDLGRAQGESNLYKMGTAITDASDAFANWAGLERTGASIEGDTVGQLSLNGKTLDVFKAIAEESGEEITEVALAQMFRKNPVLLSIVTGLSTGEAIQAGQEQAKAVIAELDKSGQLQNSDQYLKYLNLYDGDEEKTKAFLADEIVYNSIATVGTVGFTDALTNALPLKGIGNLAIQGGMEGVQEGVEGWAVLKAANTLFDDIDINTLENLAGNMATGVLIGTGTTSVMNTADAAAKAISSGVKSGGKLFGPETSTIQFDKTKENNTLNVAGMDTDQIAALVNSSIGIDDINAMSTADIVNLVNSSLGADDKSTLASSDGKTGTDQLASENLMANELSTANVSIKDKAGGDTVLTNLSTGLQVTIPAGTDATLLDGVVKAVDNNDDLAVTDIIKNAKITGIDLTRTDDDTITKASEMTGLDSDKMALEAANAGKTFTLDETGGVVRRNTGNAELTIGGVSIDSLKALGLSEDLDGAAEFNARLANGTLTAGQLQNALTEMNNKEANTIETIDTTEDVFSGISTDPTENNNFPAEIRETFTEGSDGKLYSDNGFGVPFTGKHPDTGIEYVNGVKKDTSGIAGLGSEEQLDLNLTGGTGTQLTDVGNTGLASLDGGTGDTGTGDTGTGDTGIPGALTQEQLNAITGKTDLDVNALTTSQADVVTGTDVLTNQTVSVTNAQDNNDGTFTGTDVATGNTITVTKKANQAFNTSRTGEFGQLVNVDPFTDQTFDPDVQVTDDTDPALNRGLDQSNVVNRTNSDGLTAVELMNISEGEGEVIPQTPLLPFSNFKAPTGMPAFTSMGASDPNQIVAQQTSNLLMNAYGGGSGLASFPSVSPGYSAYNSMPAARGPGAYGFAGAQNFRTAPQSYGGGYDPSTLTSNLQQAPMASEDLLSQEASFNR